MKSHEIRILLVDDDESLRRVTAYHLDAAGYVLETVASAEEALDSLEKGLPELVITDVRMPGMSGLELLRRIKSRWPEVGVLVITAHGSIEAAVEAMRDGAHDYLVKPFEHEALALSVEKAIRLSSLLQENQRLRELASSQLRFDELIGTSAAIKELTAAAAQVAPRNSTVLLLGESGTGKELLARAIHNASARSQKPFVAVQTGALPSGLIDSELFGHRRGAFTGADRDRKGKFELAQGGTLFLDEIGDLALELQVKLLRALQEGEVDPLGASSPVAVDVRVIAATFRDLAADVAAGRFREDLYYRLNVIPLTLPPLRERGEDIPLLAQHFIRRIAAENDLKAPSLSSEALEAMAHYRWPGNVRELENYMERALVLNPEGPIGLADLPPPLRSLPAGGGSLLGTLPDEGVDLERLEIELIQRALEKCGGNRSRTARYLGLTRNTLLYRLEKYGIGESGGKSAPKA